MGSLTRQTQLDPLEKNLSQPNPIMWRGERGQKNDRELQKSDPTKKHTEKWTWPNHVMSRTRDKKSDSMTRKNSTQTRVKPSWPNHVARQVRAKNPTW